MPTAIAADVCPDCLAELPEDGRCWHRRHGDRNRIPPLPPFPTQHLPGTVGKVEVMKWQDDQGYEVRHPLDATEDERPNLPSRFQSTTYREPRILRFGAGR